MRPIYILATILFFSGCTANLSSSRVSDPNEKKGLYKVEKPAINQANKDSTNDAMSRFLAAPPRKIFVNGKPNLEQLPTIIAERGITLSPNYAVEAIQFKTDGLPNVAWLKGEDNDIGQSIDLQCDTFPKEGNEQKFEKFLYQFEAKENGHAFDKIMSSAKSATLCKTKDIKFPTSGLTISRTTDTGSSPFILIENFRIDVYFAAIFDGDRIAIFTLDKKLFK